MTAQELRSVFSDYCYALGALAMFRKRKPAVKFCVYSNAFI